MIKMVSIQWVILLTLFKFIMCEMDVNTDTWDDVHMICPNQCVCQHSPYMDLSVSRWIEGLRREDMEVKKSDGEFNSNEAFFQDDTSHLRNEKIKFVMCMLPDAGNFNVSVLSLPQDVQALVLLHNGNDKDSFTVSSSDLVELHDLDILEIRGTGSYRNLIFNMEEAMPKIKYANFELIKLVADEKEVRKLIAGQHPSETYDYVPESERFSYNVTLEVEEDIEIVPYDVYVQEMEELKQATFIGWKSLKVLRIHNCKLDEVKWETFYGLENLKHLSLEHNEIKIVPKFAFYGALNIKSLSLARNSILDLDYRALAGLLELEYLDLSMNNLTKLSELTFPPFPKLKSADLRENPIEFILPMTFGIMNGTSELTLGSHSNALELAQGNGAFLGLDNLKSLNVLNVTTSSLYQTMFSGLKQLERLQLKGSVSRIEFDAFAEMPLLKQLSLSNCGIFEISMDALFGIKDLRIIDLSSNQISFVAPELFDEQKQLKEIYLHGNHLKELPKSFFSIPTLKLIRLIDNPWTCSCAMSDWNQEITNSIRTGLLTSSTIDDQCIRNAKSGKIDHCNVEADIFPQYSYSFDNKMTPLCAQSVKNKKQVSVYYALRHDIKCSSPSTVIAQKNRAQNKLEYTMKKLSRTKNYETDRKSKSDNSWKSQQQVTKLRRRTQQENKMKRTMSMSAKILKEQVHSNDIALYPLF